MNDEIKESIKKSVLCWLATTTLDGEPNVSPKEVFTTFGDDSIIIANIASPNTVKNIQLNQKVCLSFIDILVQKGYQIKGHARIVKKDSSHYSKMEQQLLEITGGLFPFHSITQITIDRVKPIVAPRYLLYPDTTEEEQIERALKAYRLSDD